MKIAVRTFIHERAWEKYHNPKDLAESICIEAAELLQLFQWIESAESSEFKTNPSKLARVQEELADVVIYCLSMADTFEVDLARAIFEKIKLNTKKYPVHLCKGKAYFTRRRNNIK